MRIAIVHDFLVDYGGAERVLESMLRLYPQADLFALYHDPTALPAHLNERVTQSTALTPWIRRLGSQHRLWTPLFPFYVEQFDFTGYDLILSSSYFCAKSILKPSTACHISYCHTPFRQVWDRYHDYCQEFRNPVARWIFKIFAHYFRVWDQAHQVDAFLACSHKVAQRIEALYRQPAQVIYPPVSLPTLAPALPTGLAPKSYFLCISRLLNTYKRLDLAISAIAQCPGQTLVVVGSGPDRDWLERIAGPQVLFLGQVNDPQRKAALLSQALALVIPGDEDFGIVCLEALAAGTPVVAYRGSGAAELLVQDRTGVVFERLEVACLAAALERVRLRQPYFVPQEARDLAQSFSHEHFETNLQHTIDQTLVRGSGLGPVPTWWPDHDPHSLYQPHRPTGWSGTMSRGFGAAPRPILPSGGFG